MAGARAGRRASKGASGLGALGQSGSGSIVGSILSGGASLLQMSALRAAGRQKALDLTFQAQTPPPRSPRRTSRAPGDRPACVRPCSTRTVSGTAAMPPPASISASAHRRWPAGGFRHRRECHRPGCAGTSARVSRLNAGREPDDHGRQARRSPTSKPTRSVCRPSAAFSRAV